jgi:hypothetical protein
VKRLVVLGIGFVAGVTSVVVGQVVAQVANDGTATLDCTGDFSDGGRLRCTIHDLVTTPPTTAPPTTAAPTTTGVTSSTSSTTSTTTPSRDVAFFEDFTGDTISDFTSRFDWSVVDLNRSSDPWMGHHDMACEGPDTERTLVHGPVSNTDPGVEFWLCGPNGPASDHLMTSNGSNRTFGITAFSPKPSFTANRVCWDVNLTESRGRRLWWEVQLLPAAAVANETSLDSQGKMVGGGVDTERGTAFLAWGEGMNGTFMKRVWPSSAVVFDFTEEYVKIWKGQTQVFDGGLASRYVTQDRATRAHHCMVDNGNGTMTLTQQRPGQADYVRTVPVSFPKPYRVIFSAQNYNAGKDGTQSNQTWHWDNILVAAS